MEDECVAMYHILFYLSFGERGEFIQAEVDPLLFLWKVQIEFVTNESFASFIAIRSDFLWSARPLYG